MRNQPRIDLLTELVTNTYDGDNADVADAILGDDDAFGALAHRLDEVGGGTAEGLEETWNQLVESLSDAALDFVAELAEHPAAYLHSLI